MLDKRELEGEVRRERGKGGSEGGGGRGGVIVRDSVLEGQRVGKEGEEEGRGGRAEAWWRYWILRI